jgi:hypothetical protein
MQCAFSIKQRLSQPENLQQVHDLLRGDPALTRAQLAQELCRQPDLRDPKGDSQIFTTARALRELEAQGRCQLPQPTVAGGRDWSTTRLDRAVPAPSGVPRVAGEVRGLRLVEVKGREHLGCATKRPIGLTSARARDGGATGPGMRASAAPEMFTR